MFVNCFLITGCMLACLQVAYGYHDGAPCSILGDPSLTPNHGGPAPQSASGRFDLELYNPASVSAFGPGFPPPPATRVFGQLIAGQTYTIKIGGPSKDSLKGFIFVASGLPSTTSTFSSLSPCVKVQQCSGGNYVTHAKDLTSAECSDVSFKWQAPVAGTVQFKSTFVQSYSSYYSATATFQIA